MPVILRPIRARLQPLNQFGAVLGRRTRLDEGGGILSSGSSLSRRSIISPFVRTPALKAAERSSSRSFASRACPSGP